MQAELYIVPVGVLEESIVTTIEVYIPDLLLVITPGNSSIVEKEEAEEKYEDAKKIGDIEIPDEDKVLYENLLETIAAKSQEEENILSKLEPAISEIVQKFQSQPQIHIPTAGEASQVLGDDIGESGIILEG